MNFHELDDPTRSKGDEDYRLRRRTELYLLACKTWKSFGLTCKDYCSWTISHIEFYEDFRMRVKDVIFERGKENLNDVRLLTSVCDFFNSGHYFEGCKKLRVL